MSFSFGSRAVDAPDDVVREARLDDVVVGVDVDRDRDLAERRRRQRLLLVGLRLTSRVVLPGGVEEEVEELVARRDLRRDHLVEPLDRLEVAERRAGAPPRPAPAARPRRARLPAPRASPVSALAPCAPAHRLRAGAGCAPRPAPPPRPKPPPAGPIAATACWSSMAFRARAPSTPEPAPAGSDCGPRPDVDGDLAR